MNIGIVGHESKKFTPAQEVRAKEIIGGLLGDPADVLVSGRSPLGGIDVWAEEIADRLGRQKIIHPPTVSSWEQGFKPRNLLIARDSEIVHVIVVQALPPGYVGREFPFCYHCKRERPVHVKSGGCWTAMRAKSARWHIL